MEVSHKLHLLQNESVFSGDPAVRDHNCSSRPDACGPNWRWQDLLLPSPTEGNDQAGSGKQPEVREGGSPCRCFILMICNVSQQTHGQKSQRASVCVCVLTEHDISRLCETFEIHMQGSAFGLYARLWACSCCSAAISFLAAVF